MVTMSRPRRSLFTTKSGVCCMRAALRGGRLRRMCPVVVSLVVLLALNAGVLLASTAPNASAATVSGSTYSSVTPYRITDTRTGSNLPNSGDTLSPGGTFTVQVTGTGGGSGVPAGATDASLNLTVTNTTAPSYVSVYPAGTSRPTVANLNFD